MTGGSATNGGCLAEASRALPGPGPGTAVVAIVGPTACGKSRFAVTLAERLGGEVINCDSMQLYRGMDIGTGKITREEMRGVAHHLLDVWDLDTKASVAAFQRLARAAIADVSARGAIPVLVGGSGLYVRAAIDDLSFPGTSQAVRERWEAELARVGPETLHAELSRRDPPAAAAILESNGRRIVRALEVLELTGSVRAVLPVELPALRALQLGVRTGRAELDRVIAARVEGMFERGLLSEVRSLRQRGLDQSPTARFAIGYREVLEYLGGRLRAEDLAGAVTSATVRLARRQDRWFRRDPRIRWLSGSGDEAAALELAAEFTASAPAQHPRVANRLDA